MNKLIITNIICAAILAGCGGDTQELNELEQTPTASLKPVNNLELSDESSNEVEAETEIDNVELLGVVNLEMPTVTKVKMSTHNNDVQLKWRSVRGATAYNIYYSDTNSVDSSSQMFTTQGTRYTHKDLNESVHNYKIQAVYDNGAVLSPLSYALSADLSKVKVSD
ncbi:hypothetical protein [Thalassotalea crassostreae]|uniref:hypothetical protein n=1 Tax=Thalassotalea crassostreae TaxID=1763536 RepID=UPI000838D25C|nr:hypothetical protein [Thalassotalea crassostreae]